MIHRYEVDPPQTSVLVHSGPDRESVAPLVDPDEYVQARMIGGRNAMGEYQKPCLITIDDGTERGRMELVWITERMAAGKLPGVRPYEPQMGVSDDQIEALVERRVQEELQRRGYVEQPSDDARALLEEGDVETERVTLFSYLGRGLPAMPSPAATAVEVVAVEPLKVEMTRAGNYRCPLDRRSFKGRQGFLRHFRMSNDPEHRKVAQQMIEAV